MHSQKLDVWKSPKKPLPQSCDTFVVVGDESCPTVFGKNSDRPTNEVHEVVRLPRKVHDEGSVVKCQYVEIPQAIRVNAVILSRPAWLWGAEMGANEHGLCAGNEAVCSLLATECDDGEERLLGMDLVRLVLERASTSREAVSVATALLDAYGQGGDCSEDGSGWCYENSFLFADPHEAWVLETAGVRWWAAERVLAGFSRNISNGLSIRRPTMIHAGLLAELQRRGWYRPLLPSPPSGEADGVPADLDWKCVMVGGSRAVAAEALEPDGREAAGAELLRRLTTRGRAFGFEEMAQILRDSASGICMCGGGFASTGSQVSVLPPASAPALHFFTTGSDPSRGCYKPVAFGPSGEVGDGGDSEAAARGQRTQAVWRLHRTRATSRAAAPLRNLEEELGRRAAAGEAAGGRLWDEAVEREAGLLQ